MKSCTGKGSETYLFFGLGEEGPHGDRGSAWGKRVRMEEEGPQNV